MAVEVAVFTPKPPVSLFESARQQVGTTYQTLIQPTLYAEVDNLGQVQRLRNTTAVLTAMRLHNSSASARTVDFRVRSSRRVSYQAEVTAGAGENWIRIGRAERPRGTPVFGWDWAQSPPVRIAPDISLISPTTGYSVAWTSDSRYVAVITTRLEVLDAANAYAVVYTSPTLSGGARPRAAAWSPDDSYLAVTYWFVVDPAVTPYLRVFDFTDISDPEEVTLPDLSAVLTDTPSHVTWVGRFLALARASAAQAVLVLDWDTGSPVYDSGMSSTLSGNTTGRQMRGLAFSPDGNRIAVAYSSGDRLRVYDISGTTATRLNDPIFVANTQRAPGLTKAVAWSADSRYLACLSAALDSTPFTVYDFNAGVSLRPLPAPTSLLPRLSAVAWSPDGRYLCIGHDQAARYTYYPTALPYLLLYDYQSGSPVRITASPQLQGFGLVFDVLWSPDGDTLLVAGVSSDPIYPPTGVDNVRLTDFSGATNYIINGSFENQTGSTPQPFGFTAVGSIPGWFSDGFPDATLFFPNRRFVDAFATDGSVYLDVVAQGLVQQPNDARLRQNISGLTENETYLLSVDITASQESSAGVQVLWNGDPVNIDGETTLPIVEDFALLPVTLQPGQSTNVELAKHMLAYGDGLQLRAIAGGVDVSASYILSTQEFVETVNEPPPPPEEEPTE